jgi:hypothetical protein
MPTSIADIVCPSASKQYIKIPVTATVNGIVVDPESDSVAFACVAPGVAPASGDFVAGSWETISGRYYARVLIGPGTSLELVTGLYEIFVKITDNPEIPVLDSGLLEISP